MNERTRLIKIFTCDCTPKCKAIDDTKWNPEKIADFIIADRKKCVERIRKPLKKFHKIWEHQQDRTRHWGNGDCTGAWDTIDEALSICDEITKESI